MAAVTHASAEARFKAEHEMMKDGAVPPQHYFLEQYKTGRTMPWDIQAVQPVIVEAEEQGLFKGGRVLDVGCGLGDNAIYLASKGYEVTAVDFSEDALKQARSRAAAKPGGEKTLTFQQADMLSPSAALLEQKWDVILDSALFHCFDEANQTTYVANLGKLIAPSGTLLLFALSEKNADPYVGPKRVSREHIQRFFNAENGWGIQEVSDVKYTSLIHAGGFAWALKVVIQRA